MVDDLSAEVQRAAAGLVEVTRGRAGGGLDYSESSLGTVEELLAEASEFAGDMSPDEVDNVARQFGCYVLEVGRRQFGGRYLWHPDRDAPVLVVGEPTFRIAMLSWDKTRGCLSGDPADNLPFFYAGFADRVRGASPGDDALYV